ncbi:MAG: SBBP repeat-containing protein [Candidatus Cloacimonetes bacterium]|nr:SBBP repeat-containing protein [Candidatus Cloacimonadota bacterium]MCF7813558.1 SBBP repeat-containing protein [Candidatus Cloacimonadota bacterium]MCF7868189.1 SBBP repeat-containing protein [Candidatus Cloacimonadota bacterium]MCF7883647.1 SBBP repeat-containing protein [Candidatus Cloacimonadota bacterium]
MKKPLILFLFFLLVFNLCSATKFNYTVSSSKFENLTVPFIENEGQIENEDVAFYAQTFGGIVFVEKGGVLTYSIQSETNKNIVLKERFQGINFKLEKGKSHNANISYFSGNDPTKWINDLNTYKSLSYGEFVKGISLDLKAYSQKVEKIFTINPGSSAEDIFVELENISYLSIIDDQLVATTDNGTLEFCKPIAYQIIDKEKVIVGVEYKLISNDCYGFRVGAYRFDLPLIIDPFLASTYIGSSENDKARSDIALDSNGNVFIAGLTVSTNYPTTGGVYDGGYNDGGSDVFVSKLSGDLSQLLASTFIGGEAGESAEGLAIDNNNNIYITGYTYGRTSGVTNYPTTSGAYQTGHTASTGGWNAFVSIFSNDLTTLSYSTLYGHTNGGDYSYGILLNGNPVDIYIVGHSANHTTGDGYEVFVLKFNNTLSTLSDSYFLYSGSSAEGQDIAMDSNNDIFIVGFTGYLSSYPFMENSGVTIGYDHTHNGGLDIFVCKIKSDMTGVDSWTYLGGSTSDWGYGIDIDSNDNIFVIGHGYSNDFPTTVGAYDGTYGSQTDVVLSKFDNTLANLSASTYIGGNEIDYGFYILLDDNDFPYITGTAGESWPTTVGAYDTSANGSTDIFVTRLLNDLSEISLSTFIGGSNEDRGISLCFDANDNLYVAGYTGSSDFPVSSGAYDESFNSMADVVLCKITDDLTLPVTLSSFTGIIENGLPTLNWTTESELENLGWNVYRSEYETGLEDNSIKLNNILIPGMGTVSVPTEYSYVDEQPVQNVGLHYYWLESVSNSGDLEIYGPVSIDLSNSNLIPETPAKSYVSQNRPNPFNPTTTIEFGIEEGETGTLAIYNSKGQKILSQEYEAGFHTFNWDAASQASGVYFYQLKTDKYFKTNKMLMLK